MKARLVLVVLTVAVAGILSGCAETDPYGLKDAPGSTSEVSTTAPDAVPVDTETPGAKIGQPSTVGTWMIVVKNTAVTNQTGELKAKSGKELRTVTFDLTNAGSLDADTHPDYFTLIGRDGTEHKPLDSGDPIFENNASARVAAGLAREFFLVFSVDKGEGPFRFTYLPMTEEGTSPPAVVEIE